MHEYWAWSHLAGESGSLNMTGNVSHDGLSIRERGNTWWEWRHCQRTQTAELESPDWTPVAARDGAMLPTNNNHVISDYHLTPTWPGPPPPVPNRTDDMSDTVSYNVSGNETGHLGLQQSWMRLTWSCTYVHGSGYDLPPSSQSQGQTSLSYLSFPNGTQQWNRHLPPMITTQINSNARESPTLWQLCTILKNVGVEGRSSSQLTFTWMPMLHLHDNKSV